MPARPTFIGSPYDSYTSQLDAWLDGAATVADLTTMPVPSDGAKVYLRGYAADNDGGQGNFLYSAASVATVDGGTILSAAGGVGRWLRQFSGPISVRWFGAKGDGTSDDTSAIGGAISAAQTVACSVYIPAGNYKLTAKLTLPSKCRLIGEGKFVTTLLHSYNGDFADLGGSVTIADLTIDGQGASFTGKGLTYSGSNGAQTIRDCQVINFADACLYYALGAGSRSNVARVTAYQVGGSTGSGKYAVVIDPTQQLSAVPRTFVQFETSGNCAFDFGGCNNVHITASTFGDCNFTADSRSVNISASRWLNQTACTVDGHNNSIVGCDVNPTLTINSGADLIQLGPNSWNHLPVTDSSGNDRNSITHGQTTYTPSLTSSGTAPSLGNGTLNGRYARSGGVISVTINLTLGSTTTLGSGELRFSLPTARINATIASGGSAVLLNGSTNYTAVVQIPGNVGYARLIRDTSGAIAASSPVAWASGDTMRLTFTYTL